VTIQTGSCIALLGCWLFATEQLFDRKADVARDLPKQRGRDVSTGVKRDRRASSVSMSELLVRSALTDFAETARLEQRDHLARPQDGDGTHDYAT